MLPLSFVLKWEPFGAISKMVFKRRKKDTYRQNSMGEYLWIYLFRKSFQDVFFSAKSKIINEILMTNFNIFFLIVSTHRMLFNIFHSLELVFLNYKLVFINRQFTLTARNVDYKEEKKTTYKQKSFRFVFIQPKSS